MSEKSVPVVLVHGWKSHPGIWNRLTPRLEETGIPSWTFDFTCLDGASMQEIARTLGEFIAAKRNETGYEDAVDIVCHSIGSCITRYLLEVIDGGSRKERVRQLIAIGPPNNGSSLAELFCDPVIGPEITGRLCGTFVPKHFDPSADIIVQECRPGSKTMTALRAAGVRQDIRYHLICAQNITQNPAFFPCFEGKTCVLGSKGGWEMTFAGDGIVSLTDSILPGTEMHILPAEPVPGNDAVQFCHIHLPRAPETVRLVIDLLRC